MKTTIIINGKEYDVELSEEEVEEITKPKPLVCGNGMMTECNVDCYSINTLCYYGHNSRIEKNLHYELQRSHFATEEQAESFDKKLQALHRLWIWHAKNDGFIPDWSDYNQKKYSFFYDYGQGDLDYDWSFICKNPFLPYFSSGEIIGKCIKECRNELNILFDKK